MDHGQEQMIGRGKMEKDASNVLGRECTLCESQLIHEILSDEPGHIENTAAHYGADNVLGKASHPDTQTMQLPARLYRSFSESNVMGFESFLDTVKQHIRSHSEDDIICVDRHKIQSSLVSLTNSNAYDGDLTFHSYENENASVEEEKRVLGLKKEETNIGINLLRCFLI